MSTREHDKKLVVFEANMEAALQSHYRRTKEGALDLHMPFDRLMSFEDALRAEDDGYDESTVGDYEMRQRVIGVRALMRWLKTRSGVARDAHYKPGPVSNILLQLFAAGRAMQDPFFSSISFTESGLLFSQTKSAASHRAKLISGILKGAGAKGHQLPGQKTPEASGIYAERAKVTRNRAKKPKQGSFLRKLGTKPEAGKRRPDSKPRQATFTRKLNAGGGATNTANGTHRTNAHARGEAPAVRTGSRPGTGKLVSPHVGASHITRSVA